MFFSIAKIVNFFYKLKSKKELSITVIIVIIKLLEAVIFQALL